VGEVADVRLLAVDREDFTVVGGGSVVRGMASADDTPVVVLDLDALIQQALLT
jgi:hypothetical protein